MASATRPRLIKFSTGRIIRRTRTAQKKAFDQIRVEMTEAIRKTIKTPYPPASTPGTPPHMRTGFLKDNTGAGGKGRTIVIRTPQYGIYLEGGTPKMAMRPFILPAIHDQRKKWERRLNALMRKFSK